MIYRYLRLAGLSFILLLGVSTLVVADTVYLKNGAWIDGIVRTRNSEVIQLDIGRIGKMEIPLEEVYEIEKNSRTGSDAVLSVEGRELEVAVGQPKDGKKSSGKKSGKTPDVEDEDEDDRQDDKAGKADGLEEEESWIDPELKKRIDGLVADLKRQKSKFRVRAQRHLRAVGPPAIPFLVPLAEDNSELVRVSVFRLFHALGDDTVIEVCIEALVDSNEYVRDFSHRALRRITGENFGYKPFASPRRREGVYKKWKKWWDEEQALLDEIQEESL